MTQQEYENKIKELQDELEQLKAAKIEAEQAKRWKPDFAAEYYRVEICNGKFSIEQVHNYNKDETEFDYVNNNCFKTEEEAEEHKKQIEYTARYKNYIEEHSEPIDWNNKKNKYMASFDYGDNKIDIDWYYIRKNQGAIYASSEQIIWNAIKEIGEDNFKKYVLGVKDGGENGQKETK